MSDECRHCGVTIEDDDPAYRVVYGRLSDVRSDNISDRQIAGPNEEVDPGADERYWCFGCYKSERAREKGAHYHYDDADELWAILEAADGALVADGKPMTIGGRGWFRVVDGAVQARHLRRYRDNNGEIQVDTAPTEGFDTAEFGEFFDEASEIRLVYLKPVDETPFVAGQNHTLGGDCGR